MRVPSPEEEQLRARSRQHDQLVRTRKALAAQGRSLLLSQGYASKGSWWRPGAFNQLRAFIPEWIGQELALWQGGEPVHGHGWRLGRRLTKGRKGLGHSLMLSIRNVAASGADVVGSYLTDHNWPFAHLVYLSAGTTAIVLILLPLLPAALMRSKDTATSKTSQDKN